MRRPKRSTVNRDPNSFFSSYRPLGAIFTSRWVSRHRDAPLTPRGHLIFDLVLVVVIVGGAVMIWFARRG
jgi:hypothetical protein